MSRIASTTTTMVATLLLAAGATALLGLGDVPYGFAGPPGGGTPQLGFQATTLRTSLEEYDATEVWTHGTAFDAGYSMIDATGKFLGAGATNLLPTVELDMLDILGRSMPNTLPSSAEQPYNLHDMPGDPGEDAFGVIETPIDGTSPTTDLTRIIRKVHASAHKGSQLDLALIQVGLNILEGVDLLTDLSAADIAHVDEELELTDGKGTVTRRYEGFPLLHYRNGSDSKTKTLTKGPSGQWETTVHQLWYDSHIESDTAFIDVSAALEEEWTVEYIIDVLDDGEDDFAPFVMYFSRGSDEVELAPPNSIPAETLAMAPRAPHVAMDSSFFPMLPGNSYRIRVKHTPGKYYNLTYHWGWRVHPPRVQAMENAAKSLPGPVLVDPDSDELQQNPDGSLVLETKALRQWELDTFGNPESDPGYDRRAVIDEMIGDLAPAKRMWRALLDAQAGSKKKAKKRMDEAQEALLDWGDRTHLPAGVEPDPDSDLTLIYLNNTLYGGWADGRRIQRWMEFQTRQGNERERDPDSFQIAQDSTLDLCLLNGDRFVHGYVNVDFGGARGWENMFESTISLRGSGAWFTFGRARWWPNAGGGPQMDPETMAQGTKEPIFVRPVRRKASGKELEPGRHDMTLHFNYDPSRRLRMYQFDPLHHDVAVYSLH